ncbi:MAG: Ser-Thr-rich glycosyl-phosphatidyl-inositol-anchored membrane family protein [Euryarchaeota archaeon ADurb.BinA087]|nr:MAG: Ser-Thr-rich glycosyl-phosphatidyl-inositol-anchored membrane family protein [Euryarchaeota archaeon ADurb.BinA087]
MIGAAANQEYGFRTSTGEKSIAGFSIDNTDPLGIGYTDIGYDPSYLGVDAPASGQTWYRGASETIRWRYAGDLGSTVTIDFLKGGTTVKRITDIPLGQGGNGSLTLTVPSGTPLGTDYSIRVTSTTLPNYTDTSHGPYAIADPSLVVTSPNGNEIFPLGSPLPMSWTSQGNPGPMVTIEVWKGTSVLKTLTGIPAGTAGNGSLVVPIPFNTPVGSDYTIRVFSSSSPTCTDTSNLPFTISPDTSSSITVVTPNGDEVWLQGSDQKFQWAYTGSPGPTVTLQVLRDSDVMAVIPGIPLGSGGTGSFNLKIPYATPAGMNYRIRVTSTSNPAYTDISDRPFSIDSALHLDSPGGGETWPQASRQTIRWFYQGNPGSTVTIDVLKNNTPVKTLTGIPLGTGGVGSVNVTIPASTPPGPDYRIRVSSTAYAACTDVSDLPFTISASA